MVQTFFNLDWKEIRSAIIIAAIGAVITFAFTNIQNSFFSPQIKAEFEEWNKTACVIGINEWNYSETCPNNADHVTVYSDEITLENSGNKQAKNVDLSIITNESIILTVNECPEANIRLNNDERHLKFEFKRLSTKIQCHLEFETLHQNAISKIVITGDDIQGYEISNGKVVQSETTTLIIFVLLYVTMLVGASSYVIIQVIKFIQIPLKIKKFKIPTKVKSYYCQFRIEEPVGTSPESAEKKVIELRDNWLKTIRDLSKTHLTKTDSDKVEILQLKEGIVQVLLDSITTQSRGQLFRAANFSIRTEKRSVIEKVLKSGKIPCWAIFWELYTEFDVPFAVNMIKDKLGRSPGSSASLMNGKDTIVTDATYSLVNLENATLRISISKGTEKSGGRIGLIFDGVENYGFYTIHSMMRLRIILFMLYGELSLSKFVEIIKKMLKNPHNG